MQANQVRHIKSGHEFNGYFPMATGIDAVVATSAGLDQTIELIRRIVPETLSDTTGIAKRLKQNSLSATCKAIWDFVYHHIQYRRDKVGVEQVRRPSRSWADRQEGVDCDCYSVFISSILMNLGIAHSIRITKYNGRPNFQHVYPIVPTGSGHITMDCVTDHFNHEVPFSDHRDYKMKDIKTNHQGLSGVDVLDLESHNLDALLQPRLPLRHTSGNEACNLTINVHHRYLTKQHTGIKKSRPQQAAQKAPRKRHTKQAKVVSPYRNGSNSKVFSGQKSAKMLPKRSGSGAFIKTLLVFGIGYGTYKLFSTSKPKPKKKSTLKTKKQQ